MKTTTIVLLLPFFAFAQFKSYRNVIGVNFYQDTIAVENSRYPKLAVEYMCEDKKLNSTMILVIDSKNYDFVFKKILQWDSLKEEFIKFSEFYVLSVDSKNKPENTDQAIIAFLNQVDKSRLYSYDIKAHRFIYKSYAKEPKEVEGIYFLKDKNDICRFFECQN